MVKDHSPANSEPPTHLSRRSRDRQGVAPMQTISHRTQSRDRQGAAWPLGCDATRRYRGAEVALATQKIASHPGDYKIEYGLAKPFQGRGRRGDWDGQERLPDAARTGRL